MLQDEDALHAHVSAGLEDPTYTGAEQVQVLEGL